MNPTLTASQADALRCYRRQLCDANTTLKQLLAKRRAFEEARIPTQLKIDALTGNPTLDDAEILNLVTAERKLDLIFAVLGSLSPKISTTELFLLDQMRRLSDVFREISPSATPIWAGPSAPTSERATVAVEQIDAVLATVTNP